MSSIPTSVSAANGRNDKVHFTARLTKVVFRDPLNSPECEGDMFTFLRRCGAPPQNEHGQHESYSKIFNVTPLNAPHSSDSSSADPLMAPLKKCYVLNVRLTAVDYDGIKYPPPWFSGKVFFTKAHYSLNRGALIVTTDLFVNVNRALNHRRAALAAGGGAHSILGSIGNVSSDLEGNDNLAAHDISPGEHDNARWAVHESVMLALRQDLKRSAIFTCGAGGFHLEGAACDFSLREVETCWDIFLPESNALNVLAGILPALFQYGCRRCAQGNMNMVTMEISSSESLVVYVKTPQRLRFEIRHYPPKGNVPYSSLDLEKMQEKLDFYRTKAAERVNEVLAFLHSPQAQTPPSKDWERFALKWGACCGQKMETAEMLFELFRQNGFIKGGNKLACIEGGEQMLRKARDAGIIEHSKGAFRPVFPAPPEPEPETVPYLVNRNGYYYYRRRIPDDLFEDYQKRNLYFSLNTSDFAEGRQKAKEQTEHYDAEFAQKRSQHG